MSFRAGPACLTASRASRPTNSPFSSLTTRPRLASNGFVSRSSSLPYSGMPASSRSVSRAPSPHGRSPCRLAGGRDAPPTPRGARSRIAEELEAVLAGVAGAGDEARDAGHRPLGGVVVAERVEVDIGQAGQDRCRARAPAARRARSRRCGPRARRPKSAPPMQVGELLDHGLAVRGVADDQNRSVAEPVDDEVVDDAAVGLAQHRVLRLAVSRAPGIADDGVAQEGDRAAPRTSTSPMCDRSNRPTADRTVRCSSMIEVYWTGIS